LPPDSVRTARVTPVGRTSREVVSSVAVRRSAPLLRKPARANRRIDETVMLL
jgi:hypothetical protein